MGRQLTQIGCTHDRIPFGVCSMQGRRYYHEDAHVAEGLLYAIIDGTKSNYSAIRYSVSLMGTVVLLRLITLQ